ncbi:hypothetical protein V6N13_083947 [Hibiscus sabdariffa]
MKSPINTNRQQAHDLDLKDHVSVQINVGHLAANSPLLLFVDLFVPRVMLVLLCAGFGIWQKKKAQVPQQ